jgi:hypothetical protein
MKYTVDAMLTQLGYSINESVKAQMKNIIENTGNFMHIQKHIIQLNDTLKPFQAYVAMSNSNNYLKIKNESSGSTLQEVDEMIKEWAKKYKINLQKVKDKETYYILGKD